jgi:hypothetical protein
MAIKVANNQSLTAITSIPASITGGAMTLLETQTASSSDTLDFTDNIDSTYDEYVFKFYDIHPATQNANLAFQVDTGTNTNYNQAITSTSFRAYHFEGDLNAVLEYLTAHDAAQGTGFQNLNYIGNDNDMCAAGELKIFSPSSSTFVKHFIGRVQTYGDGGGQDLSEDWYTAGYFNTTTALTRVQFKMSSGNIDSGVIKLYGIS